MLHVLKHHDEWISVHAYSVEFNDVVVLQVGEQLSFSLEVLPGWQVGIFQCLKEEMKSIFMNNLFYLSLWKPENACFFTKFCLQEVFVYVLFAWVCLICSNSDLLK